MFLSRLRGWVRCVAIAVTMVGLPVGANAESCLAGQSPRLIAYPEEDNEAGRTNVRELAQAIEQRGLRARFCIELRLIPVRFDDDLQRQLTVALAGEPVSVLMAGAWSIAAAARAVLPQVPMIFASHLDPVVGGLSDSWQRPGRRATGLTWFRPLALKQLELLQRAYPHVRRVGLLADSKWQLQEDFGKLSLEARNRLSLTLVPVPCETLTQCQASMAALRAPAVQAWLAPYVSVFAVHTDAMVQRLTETGLPTMYGYAAPVRAGGLMAYEADIDDFMAAWARMLEAVLGGADPGRIPIEQARSYRLVVNLEAAARLPVAMTSAVLLRADEVGTWPVSAQGRPR